MSIDQVDSNSSGGSEIDVDALLSTEAPSRDIPMRSEQAAAAAPQTAQEYSLKVGGKEVKAPLEKVLQWAQMGYDYPQKAQEFNTIKTKYEQMAARQQELDQIEQKWKPYKEVDEYAAKNPDWWKQVQESYQQKIAGAETSPEIAELKQELAELQAFKNELSQEKKSQKIENEDKQLAGEVDGLRKQFPQIDFDSPDEEGNSLEVKILKHAMDNDIKSFRVAFRDYYHDHLLSQAREQGKEIVSKEVQKRTKLGILGESPKPTKGLKVAENVKDKTYEDLLREAMGELQQT